MKTLLIPEHPPEWVNYIRPEHIDDKAPYSSKKINLSDRNWTWYKYQSLFEIERGVGAKKKEINDDGITPVVSSTEQNNGLIGKINGPAVHNGNVISVVRNGGSVASAFYQAEPFSSNEDVHVFNPKFELNPFRAMFLLPLIRKEKYRYSYGRKWGITRMNETQIKLPSTKNGEPDWVFMEDFIKSLPYSKAL